MVRTKNPKGVDSFAALPRNPSGQAPRKVLRERLWAGHDRRIF